jgi:hypothetical protein
MEDRECQDWHKHHTETEEKAAARHSGLLEAQAAESYGTAPAPPPQRRCSRRAPRPEQWGHSEGRESETQRGQREGRVELCHGVDQRVGGAHDQSGEQQREIGMVLRRGRTARARAIAHPPPPSVI